MVSSAPGAVEARDAGDGLGEPQRLLDRSDAERRRRPAVQHDPVVDTVRGEEPSPALLAHVDTVADGLRRRG